MDRDQDGYRYREPKQSGNMPIILLLIVIAIGIVVGVVFLAKSNSEQVYQRKLKEAMVEFWSLEQDYKKLMSTPVDIDEIGGRIAKDHKETRSKIRLRQIELGNQFPEIRKMLPF